MSECANPDEGNIKGLPTMDNIKALKRVLSSYLYRIIMHGASRLNQAANPALTFVANFPPCLQSTTIPDPKSEFDTKHLFTFLPKTGTIGDMLNFYFTFSFSAPYESFIPMDGIESNFFFPDGLSNPCNQALVKFRKTIFDFIESYDGQAPQFYQWPLSIET